MNYVQMQYLCGIGSYIAIHLVNGNAVEGTLISIDRDGVEVLTDIGSSRVIKNKEIMDINSLGIEKNFDMPEVNQAVRRYRSIANTVAARNPMMFYKAFGDEISRAIGILESLDSIEYCRLLNILKNTNEIKYRNLMECDINNYLSIIEQIFIHDRDICRCVQFLLWYGAGCGYKAMSVLTSDLISDNGQKSDELYKQLGIANQMIGKVDAITLYWLGRYYQENPERALAENELYCSDLWIAYLDLSCDMLYFEGIPQILVHLLQNNGEKGRHCAYCSLYRLFSRSGNHTLSREAIAALLPECGLSKLARSVQELTGYLKSDMDGHCFFAAKAIDNVIHEGVVHYANTLEDFCYGYLYDYTATKHHGRILGFDLMTYFLPLSVIPESRRKEIRLGFDLSQYDGNRILMQPVVFHAEASFRRGLSYAVTKLY